MNALTPRDVWVAVGPDNLTTVVLRRGPRAAERTAAALERVTTGSTVILVRPAACRLRGVRRSLQRAGLVADETFVLLPSARKPLLLVGTNAASMSYATTALLAVPPRTARLGFAWALACRLLRTRAGTWLLRQTGPRAIVGRPS